MPPQIQEASDLAEFESETLYAADKGQRLNVFLFVLTEAPFCSWGPRQQGVALVEPNRVNTKADLLCDDANLHWLGSFLEATPWSIVQSQAFISEPGTHAVVSHLIETIYDGGGLSGEIVRSHP